MGISAPLISAVGVLAAVIAMMVDGRRAVAIAVAVVSVGMIPSAAIFGGAPGVAVLGAAAVAGVLLAWAGWAGGRLLPWVAGLDPIVPAFAPPDRLFGPRSVRAFGAAVAVPIASWVSFNIPVGQVAVVEGLLFPTAYTWCCGLIRLVVARTVEDLAVGAAMVSLSSGTAWLLRSGTDSLPGAVIACAVAPAAALTAGWLAGRSARRPQPSGEVQA
jgi:hypothetical protein